MHNIFDRFPFFITSDIRTKRPKNYMMPITADVMERRHRLFFRDTDIKNKIILDLGCCVAATGAWVLDHGAAHYTGVELQKPFVMQSQNNLSRVFESGTWNIIEQDISGYLQNCQNTFDVILISGSIYSLIDYYSCIKHMCRIAKEIVIESYHPYMGLKSLFPNLTDAQLMQKWREFAVVSFEKSGQALHIGASLQHDSCRPSMRAFEKLFEHMGWQMFYDINEQAVNQLPDIYSLNSPGYAIRFIVRAIPHKKNCFDFQDCLAAPSEAQYDLKQW